MTASAFGQLAAAAQTAHIDQDTFATSLEQMNKRLGEVAMTGTGKAAEALKITAPDLLKLEVIDEIVLEPVGGAHTNPNQAAALLDVALQRSLAEVSALGVQERLDQRYAKFRKMGSVGIIEG